MQIDKILMSNNKNAEGIVDYLIERNTIISPDMFKRKVKKKNSKLES